MDHRRRSFCYVCAVFKPLLPQPLFQLSGLAFGTLISLACQSNDATVGPNSTATGGANNAGGTDGGEPVGGGTDGGKPASGGTDQASGGTGNPTDTGGSSTNNGGAAGSPGTSTDQEEALRAAIEAVDTEVPFTLLLGNASGIFFVGSQGDSSAETVYESASTSKWVTAAVVLSAVDDGALGPTDSPQDHINWWTGEANDWRSQITLTQLLAFTSGLQRPGEPPLLCTSLPGQNFDTCAQAIYAERSADDPTPGAEFVYGTHHMQIAGRMVIEALGFSSWSEVFDAFSTQHNLFPTSVYDLPSTTNPRLGGGMHWTAVEYMEFLRRLFQKDLLSEESQQRMFTDQTPINSVTITESPIDNWHYAQGNWVECSSPSWQESCSDSGRFSSPGAYGAYPFVDFGRGFYGLVARQGELGTSQAGVAVYEALESEILALVEAVQ